MEKYLEAFERITAQRLSYIKHGMDKYRAYNDLASALDGACAVATYDDAISKEDMNELCNAKREVIDHFEVSAQIFDRW